MSNSTNPTPAALAALDDDAQFRAALEAMPDGCTMIQTEALNKIIAERDALLAAARQVEETVKLLADDIACVAADIDRRAMSAQEAHDTAAWLRQIVAARTAAQPEEVSHG